MDQHRADSADLHRMRRADRARDEAWISDLVARAPFCHIATVAGDQPFITPMSFAYDPDRQALYFHTAGAGRWWPRTPPPGSAGGRRLHHATPSGTDLLPPGWYRPW